MSTKSVSKLGCKTCSKSTPKVDFKEPVSLKQETVPEISLCIEKCDAELSFTPWTIKKVAIGPPPVVNSGDTVTQDFKVTIERPTDGPSVCWNAFFTASNTGTGTAVFRLKAELTQGNTLFDDSVVNVMNVSPASFIAIDSNGDYIITLPTGKSLSGTVSSCYGSLSCPEDGSEKLNVVLTAFLGTANNVFAEVSCELLKIDSDSCVDKKCYFFTETPSCGDSVKITDVTGVVADETGCPDLAEVVEGTPFTLSKYTTGNPLVRPGDEGIVNALLICPDCFNTIDNKIELTIQTSCGNFKGGDIKNTACITVAVEDANNILVPSDSPCDKACASATVTPKVYDPEVCCKIEVDQSRVCVCKTSKVTQYPTVCDLKTEDYYFGTPTPKELIDNFGTSTFYFEIYTTTTSISVYPYCENLSLALTSFVPTTELLNPPNSYRSCKLSLAQVLAVPAPPEGDDRFYNLFRAYFTSVFNLTLIPCARENLSQTILDNLCLSYELLTDALLRAVCNTAESFITANVNIPAILTTLLPVRVPGPSTPATIDYSITPDVIEGKNVCFSFALINAAPNKTYDYKINIYDTCDNSILSTPQTGQVTVSSSTTCETVLAGNTLIKVCIPLKDLPDGAKAIGVYVDGLPRIIGCCKAIPTSNIGDLLISECIEVLCSQLTCVGCQPDFSTDAAVGKIVTVTEPKGNVDLTNLLVKLLRINCGTITLTDDEAELFLLYGLNFTLTLENNEGCCGKCVTVKNKFTLIGGSISGTCISGEHSYSTDASTYDTIQFPHCAPQIKVQEKITSKNTKLTKRVVFRK